MIDGCLLDACWILLQDAFCQGTGCTVVEIFDQSAYRNHLPIFNYSTPKRVRINKGVNASIDPHVVNGHKVYAAYLEPGMGCARGTPPFSCMRGPPVTQHRTQPVTQPVTQTFYQ